MIFLAAVWLGGLALLLNPVLWQNERFGYGIMCPPFPEPPGPNVYLAEVIGYLSLFLLSEWLFLLPRGRLSFQTSDRHRSRRAAAIGAGFIGMLLTAGLAASILELAHVWKEWLNSETTLYHVVFHSFYSFWAGMAVAWLFWAFIFYLYFRDPDHRTAVGRMTRVLLAGTVIELLVSIPAYVRSLHQPNDCYCETGSYTGLVFGCTAVFWLFGPGVYLLMLRDKRRWKPAR